MLGISGFHRPHIERNRNHFKLAGEASVDDRGWASWSSHSSRGPSEGHLGSLKKPDSTFGLPRDRADGSGKLVFQLSLKIWIEEGDGLDLLQAAHRQAEVVGLAGEIVIVIVVQIGALRHIHPGIP